tara:strand:+ start:53 stop:310 length:258 start_codon:yes stop_codon:yes gene_type:complete
MIKICKIIWLTLLLSSCGLSYTYQQNLALQRGELVKETKDKIYNFKTGKEYKDFNSIPVGVIYVIGKDKCIKIPGDGYRYIETIN